MILIIEDPVIRKFLRSALSRAGQLSLEATPQQALDMFRSGEVHVRALITNNPAPFQAVAAEFPVVYTTSCPDPEAVRGFEHCRVLQKPFHAGQLLDALHEVGLDIP